MEPKHRQKRRSNVFQRIVRMGSPLTRPGTIVLIPIVLTCTGAIFLAADATSDNTSLDEQLRMIIESHELTGDPSLGRDLPSIEDPLAQLGRELFFTKALSGDMDVACVSCHHPLLGGVDGLSLSVGVAASEPDLLGPGRTHDWKGAGIVDRDADGGPNVPRNATTTFNVAMYDQVMFFDGRVESIGKIPGKNGAGSGIITPDSLFRSPDIDAGSNLVAAQSRFPVVSEDEMLGFHFPRKQSGPELRARLAGRLGGYGADSDELTLNNWPALFRQAFARPDEPIEKLVTYDNIAIALGEYQRSQVFTDTPWNAYVKGDSKALSDSEKRGALLFYRNRQEGGAACAVCHRGDFFTDESFHVLAMPQIGQGKTNGPYLNHDNGRYKVSRLPEDKFAFRTPSLINVTVTAPYAHSGAYDTLEGVIRHHLDPEKAVAVYDYSLNSLQQFSALSVNYENAEDNTRAALNKIIENRANRIMSIERIDLDDDQLADIVAFLGSLTDPCVTTAECLKPWIVGDSDPDGLQLKAYFK